MLHDSKQNNSLQINSQLWENSWAIAKELIGRNKIFKRKKIMVEILYRIINYNIIAIRKYINKQAKKCRL
jgi:hypothetical protein